jgi:hypothetical protein
MGPNVLGLLLSDVYLEIFHLLVDTGRIQEFNGMGYSYFFQYFVIFSGNNEMLVGNFFSFNDDDVIIYLRAYGMPTI